MRKGLRDVLFSVLMLAVAGLLWWETSKPRYQVDKVQDYGFDPAFFPRILLVLWIILGLLILVRAFKVWYEEVEAQAWGTLLGAMAITAGYIWLMSEIGFLFASIPFALAMMMFLGYRNPLVLALVTMLFPLATWYCFVFLLKIPLPVSPWFTRL